jgi:uncharacterized protein (TIGR03067 family)
MKLLAVFSILMLALSINSRAQTNNFNGTWRPTKQEFAGKPFPASAYEKQTMILKDNTYTVTAESVDKGEVKYGDGNKMDIYGKDGVNAGKHFTAIYKYENGLLTICYNLAGNSYPEGFETKPNTLLFLSVFKKAE